MRCVLALLAAMSGNLAQAQSLQPPPLTSMRWGEDYSYLADPAKRSGAWWEPLKHFPLQQADGAYLTLGDELRLRYQQIWNNDFAAPKRTEGYPMVRWLPSADLHAGRLRVFGQMIASFSGRAAETRSAATDETGVEVAQAFVDWRAPQRGGRLTLRAGREVIEYGAQRLIGSGGANTRQMFDGALARWEHGGWRVDASALRPVRLQANSFDDRANPGQKLWLAYATRAPLDLYYIGFQNDAALFNQGAGRERRHTVGGRVSGSRGPWGVDAEANVQTGELAGADIRAGSTDAALRYTARLPRQPFFEVRANVISGDRDPRDNRLGTFNAMFPTAQYFGDIALLGPANLVNLRPNFGVEIDSRTRLSGGMTFFWRQSLGDGVYGPAINLIRADGGSTARYVGTQAEMALDWAHSRNVSLRFAYNLFVPGRFVKETGPGDTMQFVQATVTFKY
jgi:hypothetical protein